MDELSHNYAFALYDMLSPKERETAMDALAAIVEDLQEEEQLRKLLSSYNFSRAEKAQVLDAVYGKRFANVPHLLPFLKVVSDHHRFADLPKIYVAYRSLVHDSLGVKEGIAYSAERLSKEELASLEKAIAVRLGSQVSLTNIVDHKLLGGVKVAIDGKVFDGSLASKLEGLHQKLKGGVQG